MTLPGMLHVAESWSLMSNGKRGYTSVEAKRNFDDTFTITVDGKEVAKGIRQKDLAKKMREVLREEE